MGGHDIDGVVFEAVKYRELRNTTSRFGVRKSDWMIERYLELAKEFRGGNIIELGIFDGGSTALLSVAFRPRHMMACDITPTSNLVLDRFLQERSMTERVRLCWGVDQGDTDELDRQVSLTFGDESLDVVIDDASHILEPTTASFELLFPRLRPGGVFVIEDWSHEHWNDRNLAEVLRAGGERARRLQQSIEAAIEDESRTNQHPLSLLVLDLVIGAAHSPEVIADIRVRRGWCEVRRGPATMARSFSLRDHLGGIGSAMATRLRSQM